MRQPRRRALVVWFWAALWAGALLSSGRLAANEPYEIIDILYPGAAETIAQAVNDQRIVVGTYGANLDVRKAFNIGSHGFVRHAADAWQSLRVPESLATTASSINNAGTVVGDFYSGDGVLRAYLWDGGDYRDVTPPFALEASASDINDLGVIVGSYSATGQLSGGLGNLSSDVRGFRATPDGAGGYVFESIAWPGANVSFLSGINNAGTMVGTGLVQDLLSEDTVGFVYPSTIVRVDGLDPGAAPLLTFTDLKDVNNLGTALGNWSYFGVDTNSLQSIAFSMDLTAGSPGPPAVVEIPCPECSSSLQGNSFAEAGRRNAFGLNAEGSVVGFVTSPLGVARGFLAVPPSQADPGDFNADGIVDGSDLLLWQRGSTVPPWGEIALEAWALAFGDAGAAVGSVALPEPSSLVLFLSAWTCLTLRSRPPA